MRAKRYLRDLVLCLTIVLVVQIPSRAEAPYPSSEFITKVTWDWDTHVKLGGDSDNWPITWADDGHQYTSWGDGWGFHKIRATPKISIGFSRIEGSHLSPKYVDVWDGDHWGTGDRWDGKSYGLISVEGVLYAWFGPTSGDNFGRWMKIIYSADHAKSWEQVDWKFDQSTYGASFLNFGRDNAGARDGYVYSYVPRGNRWRLQKPGQADLARVPTGKIRDKGAYEWFCGFDAGGKPKWTKDESVRKAVFEDPNGLRTISCAHNPGFERYLLTAQHSKVGTGAETSQWGIYEATEPWGPWRTVVYYEAPNYWVDQNTGAEIIGGISFYFAPKWWSSDGESFTLVFTDDDHYGSVRGHFTVNRSR